MAKFVNLVIPIYSDEHQTKIIGSCKFIFQQGQELVFTMKTYNSQKPLGRPTYTVTMPAEVLVIEYAYISNRPVPGGHEVNFHVIKEVA